MNTKKTSGLIAAPFTPMHSDASINLDAIEGYSKHLHSHGVVGGFICGTTGEGMSLSVEEPRPVVRASRCGSPQASVLLLSHPIDDMIGDGKTMGCEKICAI